MSHAALQKTIDEAWEARESVSSETQGEVRDAVNSALGLMDAGCLLYTSPSPRDGLLSRMPSSA